MLYGDYHTHTPYSHGSGTIAENVAQGVKRGLKEMAITDHGATHRAYGIKKGDTAMQRAEIDACQLPIKVYLGVEANIVSSKGSIGMTQAEIDSLDILLVGYHHLVKCNIKDFFCMFLPNKLYKVLHIPVSRKVRQRTTDAIISAMEKYPIDIFTHLSKGSPLYIDQVAKVAAKTNTLIELNGKRISFTQSDVDCLVAAGVKFIINSDAHSANRVGEVDNAISFALKHRIPDELIVNMSGLPKLKRVQR